MGHLRRFRRQMGTASKGSKSRPAPPNAPERVDLEMRELEAILERSKAGPLSEPDYQQLRCVVQTLYFLTQELEKKHVSIQRLKQMLFGATTESTRQVMERILEETEQENRPGEEDPKAGSDSQPAPKARGHGRNGTDAYTGADTVRVPYESLQPGDPCPACKQGTVYGTAPGRIIRIRGQAPLGATVYELQKLRCNLCGAIFTAPPPAGVGAAKYDAESASMIALLKYGSGVPFNRLARLEGSLGIPLPPATQWDIVRDTARTIEPVFAAMIHQAAQGRIIHHDDTTIKILEWMKHRRESVEADAAKKPERRGIFTSGVLSVLDDCRISLFFTGRHHAGENLVALLQQRACDLGPPIQMCDALSRNMPAELDTILAHCLTHGRRQFVEVSRNFPQECLYVLEVLQDIYTNDAEAKRQGLSAEQRLMWHQKHSGPRMENLKIWLTEQIEQHKVEPNSGLGEAITYMCKHWEPLTLFLRVAGAPLDNNACEAALKKAILHRKNAYFYKTENGAHVGDLFMSLIHTCELNKVNAFEYLTALQKNASRLASDPDHWLLWNYRRTLQTATAP